MFRINGSCSYIQPLPSIIQRPTDKTNPRLLKIPLQRLECKYSFLGRWHDSLISLLRFSFSDYWLRIYWNPRYEDCESENASYMVEMYFYAGQIKHQSFHVHVSSLLLFSVGFPSSEQLQCERGVWEGEWPLVPLKSTNWRGKETAGLLPLCCTAGYFLSAMWPQCTRYYIETKTSTHTLYIRLYSVVRFYLPLYQSIVPSFCCSVVQSFGPP